MNKLRALLFAILLPLMAYPQANGSRVSGKIVDVDGAGIDYAVINLFTADGKTPVKNTMTNDGGKFILQGITAGTYQLKISFVGYLTWTRNPFMVTDRQNVELGAITLQQDNQILDEIVITEKKPEVEVDADKITYNVDQSLMAEGSTATDILKNVPLVNVDIDGRATIAGKRNTRIFIDGKPSDYRAANMAELLNVLPSDAIEKIEVITNPPVEYASDGDGVINIVLKKGFKIGLNGNIAATASTRGNYNGSGYLAYRTDSISLSSNFGARYNINQSNGYSLRQTFTPDTNYLDQFSESDGHNWGNNWRNSVDWDANKNNNLRLTTNLSFNSSRNQSQTDYHYFNSQRIENSLRKQDNNNKSKSFNFSGDFDYTLKLPKINSNLTASVAYNGNSNTSDRRFNRTFFNPDGTPTGALPTQQYNQSDLDNGGLELQSNFTKNFKGKPGKSFQLGLQANIRENDNDVFAQNYNFATNQYEINPSITNQFVYNEGIYSMYSSFSTRSKTKWTARIGARAELTDVRFTTKAGNYNIDPYISFFPNLSVNKTFKDKYNFGLSYSVRISRPRENTLNPQIENSDPVNISYGNPDLRPSYTHQVEMTFGMFSSKWSVSPRFGYATTSGIIERIRTIDAQGISRSTFENLGNSQSFTASLFGNYRPTKKISTNASVSVSKITYHTTNSNALNRSGLSVNANANLSFQLPGKAAAESNLNFSSNTAAQGRNNGSVYSSFGVRKTFLQNKLALRFLATDPFNQRNNTLFTEGPNFKVESFSSVATRNFALTMNYRFTKVGRNSVSKKQKKDQGPSEF